MEENNANNLQLNSEESIAENTALELADKGVTESVQTTLPPKNKLWIFYLVAGVLALVLIATILVNNLVFIKIQVDGESMTNTLQNGDIVTANKVIDANYGDIIVIDGELIEEGVSKLIIKRAIAFGGDTVRIEDGLVYLKKAGETEFSLLDESSYVKEVGKTFYPDKNDSSDIFRWEITVPDNEIFYLGDNRTGSSDSRYSEFSTCKTSQVVAVVQNNLLWTRGINKFFNKLISRD